MSGNSRLHTCHFLCLHSDRLDPRWVAWLWGISMVVVVVVGKQLTQTLLRGGLTCLSAGAPAKTIIISRRTNIRPLIKRRLWRACLPSVSV